MSNSNANIIRLDQVKSLEAAAKESVVVVTEDLFWDNVVLFSTVKQNLTDNPRLNYIFYLDDTPRSRRDRKFFTQNLEAYEINLKNRIFFYFVPQGFIFGQSALVDLRLKSATGWTRPENICKFMIKLSSAGLSSLSKYVTRLDELVSRGVEEKRLKRMPKVNISAITSYLDDIMKKKRVDYLTPVEANRLLAKRGLLNDSPHRPGLPLRNLLRAKLLPHAFQVGGKGSEWRIPRRSFRK